MNLSDFKKAFDTTKFYANDTLDEIKTRVNIAEATLRKITDEYHNEGFGRLADEIKKMYPNGLNRKEDFMPKAKKKKKSKK